MDYIACPEVQWTVLAEPQRRRSAVRWPADYRPPRSRGQQTTGEPDATVTGEKRTAQEITPCWSDARITGVLACQDLTAVDWRWQLLDSGQSAQLQENAS